MEYGESSSEKNLGGSEGGKENDQSILYEKN